MLITDQGFRDAVTRAVAQAQRARDERDTCPFEMEGCGRKGVLCNVTQRGMTLCRFCPACGWNTFGIRERKSAAKAGAFYGGRYERKRKGAVAQTDIVSAYPDTVPGRMKRVSKSANRKVSKTRRKK